ncbi:MAG: lysophospholipid acyltransferase family protein [Cyclobacteriaceae bacterium]
MLKLLQRVYLTYALIWFSVLFLLFLPFLLIPIYSPSRFQLVGILNRFWAYGSFTGWLLPWKIILKGNIDPSKQYIFCPNHFSYIDIPAMALSPFNAVFVGKHDMGSIPLFGFMYSKLHILVDRSKRSSRYETYVRSGSALDQGKSLVIFPEGGIWSDAPPKLARFKDGPFRLAVEKQIPIIPVTLPDNHFILMDGPLRLKPGKLRLIFHEPVMPESSDPGESDLLKEKVFNIIQQELNQCVPT